MKTVKRYEAWQVVLTKIASEIKNDVSHLRFLLTELIQITVVNNTKDSRK